MSKLTHIGLILDGNRRYAKTNGLSLKAGHKKGADKFIEALKWIDAQGITEVTAYVLSTENLKREQSQVQDLFSLFDLFFNDLLNEKKEINAQITFIGNWTLFSQSMQDKMSQVQNKTAKYTDKKLNLCFGYGGREELTHACKIIAQKVAKGDLNVEDITSKTLSQSLYISSEPQLIIRTGNKSRTSNFLPFQSIYSEWFFLNKMWPEITKNDILGVLADYQTIERNFGI